MFKGNRHLQEVLSYDAAKIVVESREEAPGKEPSTFMEGIFIQGDVKNANGRVYPVQQIRSAVDQLNEQINGGFSVCGEVDHPEDLKINLDRVSHMIQKMWMDGPNGIGKLKLLPTPMGKLVDTMLQSGVKLGVSSRGSGNVDDATGRVSDFEIVTVDIVAQPSAPNAYPRTVYESLMNMRYGHRMFDMSKNAVGGDTLAQKHLKNEIVKVIKDLKI